LKGGDPALFLYHFKRQFDGITLDDKRFLDIGCGAGLTSLALATIPHNTHVTAIDEYEGVGEDAANFDRLRDIIREHSIENIELVKQDYRENDFEEGSFDVIVAGFSLHHIVDSRGNLMSDPVTREEWLNLLHSIRALLKPGGTVIATEVQGNCLWRTIPARYRHIDWELHPGRSELASVFREVFGWVDVRNVVSFRLRAAERLLGRTAYYSYVVCPDIRLVAQRSTGSRAVPDAGRNPEEGRD